MTAPCVVCAKATRFIKRSSPTCSLECRAAHKKQYNADYRAANRSAIQAQQRESSRTRYAALTSEEREVQRCSNRAWRKRNREKVLRYKKQYRESTNGKAATRAYLSKPEVMERARIRGCTYGKTWRQKNVRRLLRKKYGPAYRRMIALRNLKLTPNYQIRRRKLTNESHIRHYWRDPERARALQHVYEQSTQCQTNRRRLRRLGAASYVVLCRLGIMQPIRNDPLKRRRYHTIALRAIQEVGLYDEIERKYAS